MLYSIRVAIKYTKLIVDLLKHYLLDTYTATYNIKLQPRQPHYSGSC